MKTVTLSQKSINAALQLSFAILKSHGVKSAKDITIDVKDGILYVEFAAADTTLKEYSIPLS